MHSPRSLGNKCSGRSRLPPCYKQTLKVSRSEATWRNGDVWIFLSYSTQPTWGKDVWVKVLSRPVKPSDSSIPAPACCLTESRERLEVRTTLLNPEYTELWERILECWFKPLSFGVFCYTAAGNQNTDIGYLLFGFIFSHNIPLLLDKICI